jgi:hypothetical protein
MIEMALQLSTKNFKQNRIRLFGLAAVLAVAIAVSIWLIAVAGQDNGGEQYMLFGDYEVYPSVEALVASADLVVEGKVGPVVMREIDRGGDPEVDPETGEKIPGVPMAFSEVTITNVLWASPRVEALTAETILVATVDSELIVTNQESPLNEGEQVMLFLRRRDPSTAPGLTPDSFYVPLSGDNGVFDVRDSVATPRLEAVVNLRGFDVAAGPTPERSTGFNLVEIKQLLIDIAP